MRGLGSRLYSGFLRSRFARGIAVLVGGTAFSQGLALLVIPLITRLYTPADFGVLSVFGSILSLSLIVASLRYELAIPLPEDDTTATELLVLALVITWFTSLSLAVAIWLFGDHVVLWVNTPALRPYLWLLPIGLFLAGAYQSLNYWAIRERAFRRIARTRITQSIGLSTVQSGLGLLQAGSIGLLLGDLVGRASGVLPLAILAWGKDTLRRGVTLHGLKRAAIAYRRFPLLASGSGLLNAGGLYLPALLLAGGYGPHVAGLFALGQRVIDAPSRLIGTAVAQVYYAEAASLQRSNPAGLYHLYFRTAIQLLLIGGIPVGLVGLISPWLFSRLFGAAWYEAGVYIQALAFYIAVRFVVFPLGQTLNIIERQGLQLAWDAGRLLVVLSTLVIGLKLEWAPLRTLHLFGAGMALTYVALFLLAARELMSMKSAGSAVTAAP